ncbi:MAG: alanine--tRNA ligase [Candidatus Paraimprobicoccus trichonymphae]|uniref:Alanine--tRNA ligase n=1 Tax=Candidatus Paraimprobicoccus trichonymphae TaxID=3033793 RepID=A0AA48HZC5_9FIRM|nr:MAG: alanine--tRNA ligase [Candidatus Paraimprobicoccus trichonymphae]
MVKISSKEIIDKFLLFFQENKHLLIKNSSIIPENDPTLLYINSGMAPIKNFFTGEEKPLVNKLCNIQTCIRTVDIDSIGDRHHLTSFSMLGSWSINDYFKEKAISLAFEFLTKCLNIDKKKLYITVFFGNEELNLLPDEESIIYWKKVGVDENHIIKCGIKDNFWGPNSEVGVCGPCTEVFYDTGVGEKYDINKNNFDTKNRYIEIWNAGVFMQFYKNSDKKFSRLNFKSVDTGAGLERLSMVLNECKSVYDTDLLNPIKEFIEELSENKLPEKEKLIITDHMRTVVMILSEKVSISNEGREYIPRKLIRKCIMFLFKYNLKNIDLCEIAEFIIDKYSNLFFNFKLNKNYIIYSLKKEQEKFKKVLDLGLEKLKYVKCENISGDYIFELVTSFGLPFEIIQEFALDHNLILNEENYLKRLKEHKKISKKVLISENETLNFSEELKNFKPTKFSGYENLYCEAKILKVFNIEKKLVLILDETCFYAESGGQLSDIGYIFNDDIKIKIEKVKKDENNVFLHIGVLASGNLDNFSKIVSLEVDFEKRRNLRNNHSSIHILQAILKKKYGNNLNQAGSKIEEDKSRFDFNYENTISQDEIFEIEKRVNFYIRENLKIITNIENLSNAVKSGATALFEKKYSDKVRVVKIGDISKELCGGTHANMTGEIGLFKILSVKSISKGVKRIIISTSENALEYTQEIFKNNLELLKNRKKLSEGCQNKKINFNNTSYFEKNNVNFGFVMTEKNYKNLKEDLKNFSDKKNIVLLCIIENEDKNQIIITVGNIYKNKIFANELLNKLFENLSGKGGGNPRIASGIVEAKAETTINNFKSNI